jgi:hypothetical protein
VSEVDGGAAVVVPVRADQQQRELADPAGEQAEHVEGRLVRPVQVLQHQDGVAAGRRPRVLGDRRRDLVRLRAAGEQRAEPVHVVGEVRERTQRPRRDSGAHAPHRTMPGGRHSAWNRRSSAVFPLPALPGEQHHDAAGPAADGVPRRVQRRELRAAFEQHGLVPGSDPDPHPASVTPAPQRARERVFAHPRRCIRSRTVGLSGCRRPSAARRAAVRQPARASASGRTGVRSPVVVADGGKRPGHPGRRELGVIAELAGQPGEQPAFRVAAASSRPPAYLLGGRVLGRWRVDANSAAARIRALFGGPACGPESSRSRPHGRSPRFRSAWMGHCAPPARVQRPILATRPAPP